MYLCFFSLSFKSSLEKNFHILFPLESSAVCKSLCLEATVNAHSLLIWIKLSRLYPIRSSTGTVLALQPSTLCPKSFGSWLKLLGQIQQIVFYLKKKKGLSNALNSQFSEHVPHLKMWTDEHM